MKKTFFYLLLASALGSYSLHAAETKWAAEATDVKVRLVGAPFKTPPPPYKVRPISATAFAGDKKAAEKTFGASLSSDKDGAVWGVVNIPIEIGAIGRNPIYKESESSRKKLPARFVKSLEVTAYVLFRKSPKAIDKSKGANELDTKNYYLLEKKITYVDIPMEKNARQEKDAGFSDDAGYAKMNVGLFLSPSSILQLTGYDDTADITAVDKALNVAAIAIVPTAGGIPCRAIEKSGASASSPNDYVSVIYDSKMKGVVGSKAWWKEENAAKFDKTSAELRCISETPFAPAYALSYPATKPLYGSPESSSSSSRSSSSGSDSAADSDTTSTGSSTSSSSSSSSSSSASSLD